MRNTDKNRACKYCSRAYTKITPTNMALANSIEAALCDTTTASTATEFFSSFARYCSIACRNKGHNKFPVIKPRKVLSDEEILEKRREIKLKKAKEMQNDCVKKCRCASCLVIRSLSEMGTAMQGSDLTVQGLDLEVEVEVAVINE